jgi:hypothetical protein
MVLTPRDDRNRQLQVPSLCCKVGCSCKERSITVLSAAPHHITPTVKHFSLFFVISTVVSCCTAFTVDRRWQSYRPWTNTTWHNRNGGGMPCANVRGRDLAHRYHRSTNQRRSSHQCPCSTTLKILKAQQFAKGCQQHFSPQDAQLQSLLDSI